MANKNLGTITIGLEIVAGKFQATIKRIREQFKAMADGFKKHKGVITALSTTFLAVKAAVGKVVDVVKSLARAFGAAIAHGAKFNLEMKKTLALSNNANKGAVKGAVLRQAAKHNFTPDSVIGGHKALQRAGLSSQAATANLGTVTTFARAAEIQDPGSAANELARANISLQRNPNQMKALGDMILKAANMSPQSPQEVLTAVGKSGGIMANRGYKVEEGLAIIASLADVGITGDDAARTFEQLSRAVQEAGSRSGLAKDLFYDTGADGLSYRKSMPDILQAVDTYLSSKGLAPGSFERQEAMEKDLGFELKELSRKFVLLLGADAKMRANIGSVAGAPGEDITATIAKKMQEPYTQAMAKLDSEWTRMTSTLAEQMGPALLQMADIVGDELLPELMKLAPAVTDTVSALVSATGVLTSLTQGGSAAQGYKMAAQAGLAAVQGKSRAQLLHDKKMAIRAQDADAARYLKMDVGTAEYRPGFITDKQIDPWAGRAGYDSGVAAPTYGESMRRQSSKFNTIEDSFNPYRSLTRGLGYGDYGLTIAGLGHDPRTVSMGDVFENDLFRKRTAINQEFGLQQMGLAGLRGERDRLQGMTFNTPLADQSAGAIARGSVGAFSAVMEANRSAANFQKEQAHKKKIEKHQEKIEKINEEIADGVKEQNRMIEKAEGMGITLVPTEIM